ELLGLAPGLALLALCKATAVQAQSQAPAPGSSNCWPGRVRRLALGPAGDEVAAELDAGVQMVGFAPAGSGLAEGARLWLHADASALVLAVPG
ncbi:MAG: ModE family transcriptional regulator, partial [Comamonadaceae bacterium]|nr:ModE family transcriptional regulator [Comamonadaceae bacterium]